MVAIDESEAWSEAGAKEEAAAEAAAAAEGAVKERAKLAAASLDGSLCAEGDAEETFTSIEVANEIRREIRRAKTTRQHAVETRQRLVESDGLTEIDIGPKTVSAEEARWGQEGAEEDHETVRFGRRR